MANNTTLNELVSEIKNIYTRHPQLNDFGFGTTDEIGQSRKMKYPYLWMSITNSSTITKSDNSSLMSFIDFNIILIVADKVIDNINTDNNLGEEANNGLEVSSDCLNIIYDIVSEISGNVYYHKNNISIQTDINISPTWDEDDGIVNAWTAEFDIRMPFRLRDCDTPMSTKL